MQYIKSVILALISCKYTNQDLQTKAAIGEREGKLDHKTRIEVIKEEERKILEERRDSLKEDEPKKPIIQVEQEYREKEVDVAMSQNLAGMNSKQKLGSIEEL